MAVGNMDLQTLVWQQELVLLNRKIKGAIENGELGDDSLKVIGRLIARLIQIVVDDKATPGEHPLDRWDNLHVGAVATGDGAKILEKLIEHVLKGHRPDGLDEQLGTRAELSKPERPGESWPRLTGWPATWYLD